MSKQDYVVDINDNLYVCFNADTRDPSRMVRLVSNDAEMTVNLINMSEQDARILMAALIAQFPLDALGAV